MIRAAKDSGADCVKFQKSNLTEKFTRSALDKPYMSSNSFGPTYGEHKAFLEFSPDEYQTLKEFCQNEVMIAMTASAMDMTSVDFLVQLGVPFIKIGSGDSNNMLMLEKVAKMKEVVTVISTGMSDMCQVQKIHNLFKESRNLNNFVLLHCTSAYPTESKDVNLRVLDSYKQHFPDIWIGYSGHEIGYVPTLGAVAKGAKVIERHFTLDKTWKGSDHSCSLNPTEFKQMVRDIRHLEQALGSSRKTFLDCEKPCFAKLGKSVVAATSLVKGHKLDMDSLKIKVSEPHSWPASQIDDLIGKILAQDLNADDIIDESVLEWFCKAYDNWVFLKKCITNLNRSGLSFFKIHRVW